MIGGNEKEVWRVAGLRCKEGEREREGNYKRDKDEVWTEVMVGWLVGVIE